MKWNAGKVEVLNQRKTRKGVCMGRYACEGREHQSTKCSIIQVKRTRTIRVLVLMPEVLAAAVQYSLVIRLEEKYRERMRG